MEFVFCMQWIIEFFKRHATTLFFPMALILYDFAAYLSTDLIQPGIINVVRGFDADVSLAPAASQSLSRRRMALQWLLGPLSDQIGRRPVLVTGRSFFPRLYRHAVHHFNDTVSGRARGAGHQHLLYRDGRLRHGAGGVRTNESHQADGNHHLYRAGRRRSLAPLSGAALMHFVHWKVLFAIIAVMGFIAFMGLLLAMPETVQRGAVRLVDQRRTRFSRCLSQPRVPLWRRHDLAKLHPNDELGRRFQ